MEKKISKGMVLFLFLLLVLFMSLGFLYPLKLLTMINIYWPVVLVVIGILQTLNTRFKDIVSAILLMVTGIILLIFKLKVLSMEILLSSWDGSLKELILGVFEWLFTFIYEIKF